LTKYYFDKQTVAHFEMGFGMNKSQRIDLLWSDVQIAKSDASKIVDLFFSEMSETFPKGDRIEIRELYSFLQHSMIHIQVEI